MSMTIQNLFFFFLVGNYTSTQWVLNPWPCPLTLFLQGDKMRFKLELIGNKTMRTLTFLRQEINFVCFWSLVLAVQLSLIWGLQHGFLHSRRVVIKLIILWIHFLIFVGLLFYQIFQEYKCFNFWFWVSLWIMGLGHYLGRLNS